MGTILLSSVGGYAMKALKNLLLGFGMCAMALVLAISVCGCSRSSKKSGDSGSKDQEATQEQTQEPGEAKKEEAKKDETADSKYAVTIDEAKVGTDYSDEPCVFVTYTFTNVSDDDAVSFLGSVSADVYQGGVECDSAFADTNGGGNSMDKVKKGKSIQVTCAYELKDTKTDIEVEVKELFSWSDDLLASRTFKIA